MKRLVILFLLAAIAAVPMTFITLPDITGTGAVVTLSTNAIRVQWVQIISDSTNAAAMRFGECSVVSATRGLKIAAGGGYNTPVVLADPYVLSQLCLYVANGDKAYVACGN